MLRLFRQISIPQLRASWPRTLLVVAGIATGVALMVAIQVINATILGSFRRSLELSAGPADLAVTLGLGEVGFDEAVLALVRADPDVVAAVPLVRGTIAPADDPTEPLSLFGTDLSAESDLRRYRQFSTADEDAVALAVGDPRSLLLTTDFAARHGIRVGDKVRFWTPRGIDVFTVRSLIAADGAAAALGGQLAVMDLAAAQVHLDKAERLDQIDVVVREGATVDAVRARLAATLPSTLRVARPLERGAEYDGILGSFQLMLTAMSIICLVAGAYLVYNTTSTAAAHRGLVMASLRLLGAEPTRLFRLLMLEATVLGVVGAAAGIPIGIGLARLLIGHVATSMGVIFQLRFPVHALALPRSQAIIALAGVATALVASLFAARRLARLEPLEVLRAELRSLDVRTASARLVLWWLALVSVSGAALAAEVHLRSPGWGNFSATLLYVSTVVIAVPIVRWATPPAARLLRHFFRSEGAFAGASLLRAPTRSGVTIAAIALVMTLGMTFSSLTLSCQRSIASYFLGGFLTADLSVSAIATDGGWLETPLPDAVAVELRALPGIRAVETIRILPGQLYRGERIALAGGSSALSEPARYPEGWHREGDAATAYAPLVAGRGALISTQLSDRFDLHVGDAIDLESPTGIVTLAIVGVVPDYISDRGAVILNRSVLATRWHDTSVNRMLVFVQPGVTTAEARRLITTRFAGRQSLKILSMAEVVQDHARHVQRAFALMESIQLLIVIVTIAGVLDLLLSAIVERRRELALWQLIGAESGAIRRAICLESTTLGVGASILGVVVGCTTAWIWVRFNFRYLLGYALEFHLDRGRAAWFVVLTMVTTALAGRAAAAWALRQPVLKGLRTD